MIYEFVIIFHIYDAMIAQCAMTATTAVEASAL